MNSPARSEVLVQPSQQIGNPRSSQSMSDMRARLIAQRQQELHDRRPQQASVKCGGCRGRRLRG